MPRTHHRTLLPAIGCTGLLAVITFLPPRAAAQSAQVTTVTPKNPSEVAAQAAAQMQGRAKAVAAQAKALDAQAKMLEAQEKLRTAKPGKETEAAQKAADDTAKAAAEAAAEAEKLEKAAGTIGTQLINSRFALNMGVTLLNPYSVTATNGTNRLVSSDGTEAKFYIEAVYNDVWAWNPSLRARLAKRLAGHTCGKLGQLFFDWNEEGTAVDLQARLSFYAKDDKETTASAIVGSGSFGSELTVGLPIYRMLYLDSDKFPSPGAAGVPAAGQAYDRFVYDQTQAAHWFGAVASYSGVTDSDAFDIHSRWLVGLGYRAATSRLSYMDGREAALNLTVGWAMVETVEFVNDGTKEIRIHHEDVPDYRKSSAFAVEMEMYFPITSSLSAVMGTRLYNGLEPNTWNAYVAVTVPLDKLASLIK